MRIIRNSTLCIRFTKDERKEIRLAAKRQRVSETRLVRSTVISAIELGMFGLPPLEGGPIIRDYVIPKGIGKDYVERRVKP